MKRLPLRVQPTQLGAVQLMHFAPVRSPTVLQKYLLRAPKVPLEGLPFKHMARDHRAVPLVERAQRDVVTLDIAILQGKDHIELFSLDEPLNLHEHLGAAIRVLGAGLTLLMLLLACKRAREAQSGARLAILAMAVFVMLSVPNFAPWYQMWWLPLFALANLPVLTCVLKLLAWTGPLSYLVLTSTHGFGLAHETWMLLMAGVWPCMLILLDWREFVGKPPKTKAS